MNNFEANSFLMMNMNHKFNRHYMSENEKIMNAAEYMTIQQ